MAKAQQFKDEVVRRWNQFKAENLLPPNAVEPQPKGWNLDKLEKWLEENPIRNQHDIAFLTKTALAVKQQAVATLTAKEAEKRLLDKSWVGKLPWMRLIHSLVDDDEIKLLFLHRNDVSTSRMAVENRNSTEKKPKSVWERLSDKWNDPSYVVETAEIDGLHSDFVYSELICHSQVKHMVAATPEKCEGKFSNMIVAMTRVITKWEQSGQGDGGFNSDDDDEGGIQGNNEVNAEEECTQKKAAGGAPSFPLGSFKNRSNGAMQNRSSFVNARQSYVLYLWHMLETHGLLGSSLQLIGDGVASSNGASDVPSSINGGYIRGDDDDSNDDDTASSSYRSNGSLTSTRKKLKLKHDKEDLEVKVGLQKIVTTIEQLGKATFNLTSLDLQQRAKDFTIREQEMRLKEVENALKAKELEQKKLEAQQKRLEVLQRSLESLNAEKRQLCYKMYDCREDGGANDYFKMAIKDIEILIASKQAELSTESDTFSSFGTPVKNNRTPPDSTAS